jgi:hypothetical protein
VTPVEFNGRSRRGHRLETRMKALLS